ncbi:hypothetical protein R1flu_017255 [Riccia fluitans]|uniref:Uncharacterized protein n=1 Tax=Riccia fluitans TaxID=41844 RepID=A0ABD1XEL2_9MARC
MSRQIKALGVCNEATCLGLYLAHLYIHFHKMDNEEKEDSKKWKALIQIISDFNIKMEDEKESNEEIPHTTWEGEANGSKPRGKKKTVDYHDWGVQLVNLGRETLKLFEVFQVEVGSVTKKAMARNMGQIFAPPSIAEVDIQPWKKMVQNMISLLTEKQKKNKEVVEQHDYYKGRVHRSEKVPKTTMWCA